MTGSVVRPVAGRAAGGRLRSAAAVVAIAVAGAGCASGQRQAHRRLLPAPPTTEAAPVVTVPPVPPPTVVATAKVPKVQVFAGPDGAPTGTALANPNEMGVPLVFLVKTTQADWLQAMLPMRPNGATGWIRAADVSLSQDDYRVKVELGAHHLTVWKGVDVVYEDTVAIGMPSAPTPTGDFYLTEILDTGNPRGPYGPKAFGLSAFSDVYTSFAGGPGQIGLHGTNQPGLLGSNVSHGCIRITNDGILKLAGEVPPGTPISVVA